MGEVVVDACVAVKWFLNEPDTGKAAALLSDDIRRIAPDFALLELANALWKNARLGRVSKESVVSAIDAAKGFFWALVPMEQLIADAIKLALELDHPVYDCVYAIVAIKRGSVLVTTDSKIIAKATGTAYAQHFVLLADWKTETT